MATAYTHGPGPGREMAKISNNGAHVWVQPAELVLAWVRQELHTPAYTW